MEKHCPDCGTELNLDAKFCQYCGVEIADKAKNDALPQANRKSQARFLSILAFGLIALVMGVYLFRNAQPNSDKPAIELSNEVPRSAAIEGEWVGTVYKEDGAIYHYAVQITLNDSEIRGTAITSELDESGSADALIIGEYANGRLHFQEYGGDEAGDWEDQSMCFWEFDLVLEQVDGEESLTGSFEAIDCQSTGTVILTRPQ